jgi:alcohol dehydrogenase class IV
MHRSDVPDGTTLGARMVRFRFGDGVLADLPEVLDEFGVERPVLITDEGIEAAGILDRVLDELDRSVEVHYATTEPSTADFEDLPADADGFLAVGGGSCIDTAKLAAALAAHRGSAREYLGVDRVPGPIAPLLAVPTTSGTGSQATRTAVLTHDGVKRGASDECLRPDIALVDPTLTFDLPPEQPARSGFDAFVHALESLLVRDYRAVPERAITYQGANPVSRSLANRALALVHGSLEWVVASGDPAARRELSLGSHLAGAAFSLSGLGAVHALASTLGGLTDRPHGTCLAASIRVGLEFNRPEREAEYAEVARSLGVNEQAGRNDPATGAEDLLAECDRLRSAIGLPGSFTAVGLGRSDTDEIIANTLLQERRLATNPRAVSEVALRETVLAAFE